MGGLVAKKAYILSKQLHAFEGVSRRIFAIFFLATPHRGSDIAELLTRMLALGGARPFVKELHRNSPTIQAINEEFPKSSGNLQLISFFETLPMNYGIWKGLIVDKESAVLNYKNERAVYLNADHRNVARFTSRNDAAYVTIRNTLASTIGVIRSHHRLTVDAIFDEQKHMIRIFLGVTHAPEDMLRNVVTSFLDGSCEWFIQKKTFRNWRDSACSQLLWLQGNPGVGKTKLSSHVITHLRRRQAPRNCCFYFFIRNDKSGCTASAFLKSIALQLAIMHTEILNAITDILKEWRDSEIGKVDYNLIWRRLFVNGILRVKLNTPQYWVIDGLDECKQGSELLVLLMKAQEMWTICLLITSRDALSTIAPLQTKTNVFCDFISESDTRHDISLLIDSRIGSILAKDERARHAIRQKIINQAAGSFLWVDLVLSQLRKAQLSSDVKLVLSSVPTDMNELYHDILTSMSKETASKQLIKAILRWVVCASRPMTTEEFNLALKIDLEDTVGDVERSIATTCGHLVYVDAQSRVRLVHETAREFLLNNSVDSEFTVNTSQGHKSLALACLKYLTGNEMQPPRSNKLFVGTEPPTRSPFVQYAAVSVFYHVSNVGEDRQNLIPDLITFLNSLNVLTWIEYLSKNDGLYSLLQAGKTINDFTIDCRHNSVNVDSRDLSLLKSWGTDLIRLVSKFGHQLQSHRIAIPDLFVPFCPTSSAIHKRFATTQGLHLVGETEESWNDLSSVILCDRGETILAVICSDIHIAFGTMQKHIKIYSQSTFHQIRSINNEEPVMLLAFEETGKLIASAGTESIKIWVVDSGCCVNNVPIPAMCISMSFVSGNGMLLAALRNNELLYWDTLNDKRETALWTTDPDVRKNLDSRVPTCAAFNLSQGLLAVSYRGHDILVWNFSKEVLHDHYCREVGSRIKADQSQLRRATALAMVFSAAPESKALIAGYTDGELVLYDTELSIVRCSVPEVNAQTMCSSPDGRTLATGDGPGTIRIFDLESLQVLHKIDFDAEYMAINFLVFTYSNHGLLDVRGRQCRIWEPIVLLRQDADIAYSTLR